MRSFTSAGSAKHEKRGRGSDVVAMSSRSNLPAAKIARYAASIIETAAGRRMANLGCFFPLLPASAEISTLILRILCGGCNCLCGD